MATFTKEQRDALLPELVDEINNAQKIAGRNRSLDTAFRVLLLVFAVGTTVFSALGAVYKDVPHPEWALTSAILAGASTALSGFAFNQFNFTARRQTWERRADTFRALYFELKFSDPERDAFIARQIAAQKLIDPN